MIGNAIDLCQILALSSQDGLRRPFYAGPIGIQPPGMMPGGGSRHQPCRLPGHKICHGWRGTPLEAALTRSPLAPNHEDRCH